MGLLSRHDAAGNPLPRWRGAATEFEISATSLSRASACTPLGNFGLWAYQ
jgi:hypothetical protein